LIKIDFPAIGNICGRFDSTEINFQYWQAPMAELVVAEPVEASKPLPSLAFACGRFDKLNDHHNEDFI